ncbi:HSFY1 protein, partial [Sagittarius serpentarius]|nr:HSFY1 protein [Sagittarius serpentarius]
FPKKLWKMLQSHRFQSIRWADDSLCVAIDAEAFQKKVLAWRGPYRVFETDSMKSFFHQLHLCGFTKAQRDSKTSNWLDEFLAEEAAAPSAHSELLFHYNPNFERDHPHLLERCKQR